MCGMAGLAVRRCNAAPWFHRLFRDDDGDDYVFKCRDV